MRAASAGARRRVACAAERERESERAGGGEGTVQRKSKEMVAAHQTVRNELVVGHGHGVTSRLANTHRRQAETL